MKVFEAWDYDHAVVHEKSSRTVVSNHKTLYGKSEIEKTSENYYKKAINLNKNAPEPQNNLGNLYNLTNNCSSSFFSSSLV